MIIQAAVTHSDFKKSMQISSKYHFQSVETLTNTTTDAMAIACILVNWLETVCLLSCKVLEL